jgi:hypothetical protein
MHKYNQVDNAAGKSSSGVPWLQKSFEVGVLGEKIKPTIAPTKPPTQVKPTQSPVQQKPTQSPVQQKPTQSPVQQKPTQAPPRQLKPTQAPSKPVEPTQAPPVQQKPTQAPSKQLRPTLAPPRRLKPTQAPIQEPPKQVKPTQAPVQQKPTQAPWEQVKPTQAPVQQKPTEAPWQQMPTEAPVQKPTQMPWQQMPPKQELPWMDYPKQELPIEQVPPVQVKPTQAPVQQKPTQAPWQQMPTQAPVQKPTQMPWQQLPSQEWPWQELPGKEWPAQEWPEDKWSGQVGIPPYDKEYEMYPVDSDQEQLHYPIQKPGHKPNQMRPMPYTKDLAILLDDLSCLARMIDYYFKACEDLGGDLGQLFHRKALDEVKCFQRVLGLIGKIDPTQAQQLQEQSVEELWKKDKKKENPDPRQRGGFFNPPRKNPRSRLVDKTKAREYLAGAVQISVEAITIYEEQIIQVVHPEARGVLVHIIAHEKKELVQCSKYLLEILPKEA